ncbi:redoxin domain-containing protein [Undibacterium sp. TC4M20W]|uniref:redoxin domain-containing protein n=1 Tax=Undibacterium sp. TC4M20W TaxID=3413052 RepID=UPI003BF3A43A
MINNIAPELITSDWLNTDTTISLQSLRGKVIFLHSFQMLCPACVTHGLPQASAVKNAFSQQELVVIGLHTVFEHHHAMGKEALKAFIQEYRLRFPIAIDMPDPISGIPLSMQKYGLRGTPSILLLDRQGRIRFHHFGHIDDLKLGSMLGQLVAATDTTEELVSANEGKPKQAMGCNEDSCSLS